jgi:RNA polymerase sigma-70 factor, ECF subfamily
MGEISDINSLSDEELVRISIREPEAFGVLMQRFEGKLLHYIMRKSAVTREGAEDILQESFLNAYRNLNSFDSRLSFSSWIYRIVHNQTISQWRKSSVRPEGYSVPIDEDFVERIIADNDMAADVDRSILSSSVSDALAEMDEKYRNIIILRYMEDKSYSEISDIIKKPPGTVATYLSRAKKQLHKVISARETAITSELQL